MTARNRPTWWVGPLTLLRRILMLDDTPHSIAMGVTVGMFIGITPTVGIQMVLVMLLAALTWRFFQFNRMAALLTVYVSNPITTLPIYYFNYKVGTPLVVGSLIVATVCAAISYPAMRWALHVVRQQTAGQRNSPPGSGTSGGVAA